MEELKNTDKKGISTKRKIGKTTYEVVVHFDENATETMQDKLTRIMLRELRRKSNEKKRWFWLKSPWQVATGASKTNGLITSSIQFIY